MKKEIVKDLESILEKATVGVRPPSFMIKFYNFMARIPFKIGVLIFLLTAIDTLRVTINAIRNRTDAAIQVIYKYRFRPWRLIWGLGDHLWLTSYNCRSVRSRGIFTREAIKFLLGMIANDSKLKVVSLGSGSASQMLQGVAENGFKNSEIDVVLVDNDFRALEVGRKNARCLGIEDVIDLRETTVGKFLKEADASINLIEMVGLTDYFNDDRFFSYLYGIHSTLKEKGFFLGANITSKEEADYAHRVACWPQMHYRTKKEIVINLEKSGFKKIWTGDCGLYTFWVAQK